MVGGRRALFAMRSLHGIRSQRACCLVVVPPNSSLQFERSFTSSKEEVDGDYGDVVTDEKKRLVKEAWDYYTVEKAAEMAAKETVKTSTEESFGEKTRRTIKEAWDAAIHTTQEIKEGLIKRNKNCSDE